MLTSKIIRVLIILSGIVFGENAFAEITSHSTAVPIGTGRIEVLSFCEVIFQNYSLNPGYAFRDIPQSVVSPDLPDAKHLSQIMGYDEWGRDRLPVQLVMGPYGGGKYLYSMEDADCPVMLIPPEGTIISLRALALPGGVKPTLEPVNISVNDSTGNWMTLNENPCKFLKYEKYKVPTIAWEQKMDNNGNWTIELIEPEGDLPSYIHDGDWFSIKFPANKSNDFRQVTFSVATKDTYPIETGDKTDYDHLRRTWLFIQIPCSKDIEGLNQLPLPNYCKAISSEVFSPMEVHMHNYALNNSYAFRTVPNVDPEQPDIVELYKNFMLDCEYSGGFITQMRFDNLPEHCDMYSIRDAEYPIILIPAETTTVKVRALKVDPFKLDALRVPDKLGVWKSASARQKRFYSYHKEGEWFSLTFPENNSDNFREISMELVTNQDHKKGISSHETYEPYRRIWIFIQLPLTADPEIFRRIPKISRNKYMKSRK